MVIEKIEVDSQLSHTLKGFPEHKPGGMSQVGQFTWWIGAISANKAN